MANQIDSRTKWKDGSRFIYNSQIYTDPDDGILKVAYISKAIPMTPDDQYHTITAADEYRPDLISYKYYKTVQADWLLMQANDFESLKQFKAGTTIRIPALNGLKGKII